MRLTSTEKAIILAIRQVGQPAASLTWERIVLDQAKLCARNGGRFTTGMIYRQAESILKAQYPRNNSIRQNIRSTLQNLRDKGLLTHLRVGVWRV